MKKEKVITVSGIEIDKAQCRLINKEYYLIGVNNIQDSGDVYLIDGRYVRFNTGRLVFNYSSSSYQLKNDNLIYGIVDMNQECDFTMGYFNSGIDNQFLVDEDKNAYICINDKIINRSFREEISSGKFYHISLKKASLFNLIKKVPREVKESFPYDSKGIMGRFIDKYNTKYNPIINETISKYSKILGGLTFGFEFESTKGMIPRNRIEQLPLIPLRDGSIDGLEYVTIPLQGEKGVKALIDCVKEIDRRTIYDNSCSMHLHIGNIPRTPEFILAFYKVVSFYQDEMFSMFPLYKKYNFEVKRKNYSQEFPLNKINFNMDHSIDPSDKNQVNRNFDILFSHLADRNSFYDYNCDLGEVRYHPCDQNGNQKWNIKHRYYAVNFIPLIFGNKETIEFRIHTPTYDIDKILNFLLINSHLINFTIENQDVILKNSKFLSFLGGGKLSGLITEHLIRNKTLNNNQKEDLISYSINYIEERKNITYRQNCSGDIVGNENEISCHRLIDWEEKDVWRYKNLKVKSKSITIAKPKMEGNLIDKMISVQEQLEKFRGDNSLSPNGNTIPVEHTWSGHNLAISGDNLKYTITSNTIDLGAALTDAISSF